MAAIGLYGLDTSPEALRAAGLNERMFRRPPGFIPVTEADREYLGEQRNKGLKIVRGLCYTILLLSGISIVIGIVVGAVSSPQHNFPYGYFGACVTGVVCAISAGLNLWLVWEGRKTPTGDETTECFKSILTCQAIFGILAMLSVIYGGLAAGLIGYLSCTMKIDSKCVPNPAALKVLSMVTAVLCLCLGVLTFTLTIMCCCYRRAFGIKSPVEILLDVQQARMREDQRLMAAHNPYAAGRQQLPQAQYQQGTGYQHHYAGMQVSNMNTPGSTLPPSYDQAMKY